MQEKIIILDFGSQTTQHIVPFHQTVMQMAKRLFLITNFLKKIQQSKELSFPEALFRFMIKMLSK